MKKPFVDIILSFAKYLTIVLIPHLYMVLCAVAYHEIEGCDAVKHPPNQVEHFLLNNGINREANTTEYMNNFKLALKQDEYWKTRNLFNSIAKSYIYVLSLFTTTGRILKSSCAVNFSSSFINSGSSTGFFSVHLYSFMISWGKNG